MATVKHCKAGENIRLFECNCENPPERAEEFRISDHEIGELALAFEGCYERSSHGREERTRTAYIWGIYFGVIDDATAEDEFRRRFGKALEADSWWSEQ